MERGKHTIHEIKSQPHVWQSAVAVFTENQSALTDLFAENTFDKIIVTGCGSTYYLSQIGARLLQKFAALSAQAYPASEIVLYPDVMLNKNQQTLLIAVSRSGTTSETVSAIRTFKEKTSGKIITITCDSQTPLAQAADLVFAIEAAQEKSVAQTRSFSSMCVVIQQIAAHLGKENSAHSPDIAAICQSLLENYSNVAQSLGENPKIQKFFFLGSDTLYGIASEAMLKMKEMSLSYSEAFHTLEFRHGPMSMVGDDSLVVGLVSSSSADYEIQVLREMQAKGATILALGQGIVGFEHTIQIPESVPAWNVPILYLPILQLISYHRSLFNEQNPDNPHNLTAVISLDNI
ncbi:MAG: SIS domain-containing protein [Anaerolineae bacterium]|nr:SIS domain-containing protein [Anaerolineae bacterium]MDQ7037335.1 SIS domain-containing protein [Anaerolineae bacterium]